MLDPQKYGFIRHAQISVNNRITLYQPNVTLKILENILQQNFETILEQLQRFPISEVIFSH